MFLWWLNVTNDRADSWRNERRKTKMLRRVAGLPFDETVRAMQDRLLDAYGEWKRTGERRHLDEIRGLAREIRLLAPDFQFSLPSGGEA